MPLAGFALQSSLCTASTTLTSRRAFIVRPEHTGIKWRRRSSVIRAAVSVDKEADLRALFSSALKTDGGSKQGPLAPASQQLADEAGRAVADAAKVSDPVQSPSQALKALSDKATSTSSLSAGAPGAVPSSAGPVVSAKPPAPGPSLQQLNQTPSTGALGTSGSAEPAVADGPNAVSQLTDSAQAAISSAQDTATDILSNVKGTVAGLVDSGKEAATSAFNSAADATEGVRSVADNTLAAAQRSASELLGSATGAGDDAQSALAQFTSQLQDASSQFTSAASASAASALDQIPAPVQTALAQAGDFVSQGFTAAIQNPNAAAVAAIPLLGVPGLLWLRSKFTGYEGDKPVQKVAELLQTKDALLVDIRSDADRATQGVPVLARRALGKGAVVPPLKLGSARGKVRKSGDLELDLTALAISELAKVRKGSTTVIVLDRGDGRAVPIAKRLPRFGISRSCVVRGGFRQWAQAGLEVQQDGDYDVSPLLLLGTRTSLVVEEKATVLRNPAVIAAGLGVAALTVGLLTDWHRTLQLIGTNGILLTLLARTTSYQRPQDLLDDVSGMASTVVDPLMSLAGSTKVLASSAANLTQRPGNPEKVLLAPVQSQAPVQAIRNGEKESAVAAPGKTEFGSPTGATVPSQD